MVRTLVIDVIVRNDEGLDVPDRNPAADGRGSASHHRRPNARPAVIWADGDKKRKRPSTRLWKRLGTKRTVVSVSAA